MVKGLLKKIAYSSLFKKLLKIFFGMFYEKKYLQGYFFDEKRMGWYWAWMGLKSRIIGPNNKVPYPVNPNSIVSGNRVYFDYDNINIFQTPGCYWQVHDADIYIGSNCYIAPNVGLITTNHDPEDPSRHLAGKNIEIGNNCWIGMNAVILPGVVLGDHTVVAAGAVVSKSFEEGHCIIGGVPAKIIRKMEEKSV